MCGIAGIIGRLDETNAEALRRMNRAQAHRGPDGEGFWQSPPDARGRGAMLAHRRLAILDLSPAGAQPMTDPLTGDVIVFNGEIYGYEELRRRLVAEGHHFESTGDTAVMLRALAVHGPEAVRWLRGMFTFAIWDADVGRLRLARDPLGIKPLYLGPSRLRRDRNAAAGSAGGRLHGLERLRRRTRHRGGRRGSALARTPGGIRHRRPPDAVRRFLDRAGDLGRRSDGRGAPRLAARGRRAAPPRQRRPSGGVPLRRNRLLGGGEPGAAGADQSHPHLHPRLRGEGARRGPGREKDRAGHRHPAPRGGADRATVRRPPRSRARQPRSAHL